MLAQMQDAYAGLEFTLPPGVIHGDASIGNVLRDSHGHPVVIDLDGFATGPREWDLALTAIYYDSFGWHTREEYQDFVRVYGVRHHGLARLPGHAGCPRVLDGHLGHPESRRIRAGRRRGNQAHHRPAHRRQPQRLEALLDSRLIGPRRDQPQP